MNELETSIISAAIQFIAQLIPQIMSSVQATDEQKQALLAAMKTAVDAEVAKVKAAQV